MSGFYLFIRRVLIWTRLLLDEVLSMFGEVVYKGTDIPHGQFMMFR
jgi:hypothetical protein